MTPEQIDKLKRWIRDNWQEDTTEYFKDQLLKKIDELQKLPPSEKKTFKEWKDYIQEADSQEEQERRLQEYKEKINK